GLLPEVAQEELHPGDRLHGQHVQGDYPALQVATGRREALAQDLAPCPRRRTEVDDVHARPDQPVLVVDQAQLEGRPRAIAVLLREPDVRVPDVAIQPCPVDLALALLAHPSSLQYADASIRYRDPAPVTGATPRTAGRRPPPGPRRHDRGRRPVRRGAGRGRPCPDRPRADQATRVR